MAQNLDLTMAGTGTFIRSDRSNRLTSFASPTPASLESTNAKVRAQAEQVFKVWSSLRFFSVVSSAHNLYATICCSWTVTPSRSCCGYCWNGQRPSATSRPCRSVSFTNGGTKIWDHSGRYFISPQTRVFQILIAVGYKNKRPSTKNIVAAGWSVLCFSELSVLLIYCTKLVP